MRTSWLPMVSGSSTTTSAFQPSSSRPRSSQAVELRGRVGDEVDRLFERQHLALAHRLAQHLGGVVERREQVEVRAGVGRADQRARVAPHLDARLPVVVGLGCRHGAEAGVELVGPRDRRRAPATGCGPRSSAISPTIRPRYCSFSGATTSWILRLPQLASIAHRVLVAAATARRASPARRRRRRTPSFSSSGRPMTSSQPGHRVEDEPRAERQVHREAHRHRERDDVPAVLPRVGARLELLLDVGHVLAVDAEHVPVERSLRGGRHRRSSARRPTARTARPSG